MSKLVWDTTGSRIYETGVSNGVLYPLTAGGYPKGVVWNGLTGVNEKPTGAESTPMYADDIEYLNLMSNEKYSATIEAYTYPDEFAECDGSAEIAVGVEVGQQNRAPFGFCYKTKLGNDIDGINHGYILHLVYGAKASPSEKSHASVNETPEAITFSWNISTTPVVLAGKKPTSTVTINSTKVNAANLATLEEILYGKDEATGSPASPAVVARLPLPDEVATIFKTVKI